MGDKPTLYFAFGSNMNQNRMRDRGVPFTKREKCYIEDYTLAFDKKAASGAFGYATIITEIGSIVEGVLYHTTKSGLQTLDHFEGTPIHYTREEVEVVLEDNSKIKVETYIATEQNSEKGRMPTREYLNHLLEGKSLLSEQYYQNLSQTKCFDE